MLWYRSAGFFDKILKTIFSRPAGRSFRSLAKRSGSCWRIEWINVRS